MARNKNQERKSTIQQKHKIQLKVLKTLTTNRNVPEQIAEQETLYNLLERKLR